VYDFEIIEKVDKLTKNNDPMVSIKLLCQTDPYQNRTVFDNIIIPREGSPAAKIMGRTKRFLHCLGEPYEGNNIEWNSDNWGYRTVKAQISSEPSIKDPNKTFNCVKGYVLSESSSESSSSSKSKPNNTLNDMFKSNNTKLPF
jgi:hypothetical protein